MKYVLSHSDGVDELSLLVDDPDDEVQEVGLNHTAHITFTLTLTLTLTLTQTLTLTLPLPLTLCYRL